MSDLSELKRCPKCGSPIPDDAPQGLCPKCVLLQASIPTEGGKARIVPTREEVAAAFPQLEILELIGQGGMGFVFKARQPKLERLVALKILPQALAADPAFAERFTREGRALARLNHPNIVAIHDFGQAGGFFYLLMEFVDGVNLRQAMRTGRFTPAQALAVVPKICEALQFAHNEGILHRDIKPENILLDAKGRVKIADFGIAKLLGETKTETGLTGSGGTLGTPHYMAPEQLEKPGTVDHRADIYSLGVVFYEMLTGELPLGRFQPPSQKVEVDVRLDEVVLHALEKEPSRRYQTASQVKTAVETIASGPLPVSVAPAPDRFWKRVAVAMALLCLMLMVQMAWLSKSFSTIQRTLATSRYAAVSSGGTEKEAAPLVIDRATDRTFFEQAHGTNDWVFKTLIPANHLAQFVFVLWSNGVPLIKPDLSVYFKVGEKPVVSERMDMWCEVDSSHSVGRTDVIDWRVDPDFMTWANLQGTRNIASEKLSNQPSYRKLEIPLKAVLHPGHQLAIRLAEFIPPIGSDSRNWSGVEMRVFLEALHSPVIQTDPNEYDGTNYIAGFGLANASQDSIVTMIKEVPLEQATEESNQLISQPVERTESAPLVINTVKYGYDRNDPLALIWRFQSLLPAAHLTQLVFVLWSNGVPDIKPAISGYFKVGHKPVIAKDMIISYGTVPAWSHGETNVVQLNVNPGFYSTASAWISNQPPYRKLETAPHYVLHSGHQLVIRLAESAQPSGSGNSNWSGAEIRLILQPLASPPVLTDPGEYDGTNYVAGFGLAGSTEDSILKLIKELPCEPITNEKNP